MVQIVDDPRNVEGQYAHQYENLARKVADLLPTGNGVLAEIGCGRRANCPSGKASPSQPIQRRGPVHWSVLRDL